MHLCVPVCEYVHVQCSVSLKEAVRSSGFGIEGSCELSNVASGDLAGDGSWQLSLLIKNMNTRLEGWLRC